MSKMSNRCVFIFSNELTRNYLKPRAKAAFKKPVEGGLTNWATPDPALKGWAREKLYRSRILRVKDRARQNPVSGPFFPSPGVHAWVGRGPLIFPAPFRGLSVSTRAEESQSTPWFAPSCRP